MLVAEGGGVCSATQHQQVPPAGAYDTTVEMTILSAPEASAAASVSASTNIFENCAGRAHGDGLITFRTRSCASTNASALPLGVLQVGRKFDQYWDVVWYEKKL
jgi:hypothetical protein